jgi:enoyl-CoA hydratase
MSDGAAAPALRLEVADHVAAAELCRPELRNRVDDQLHDELMAVLGSTAADPEVRVLVLRSTGKVFSAGGDTARMLRHADEDPLTTLRSVDGGRALFRACADYPKPLVAAVAGDVYGLGTSIVLCADAVVSAPGVRFSDPHVHMGLVAGDGGVVAWPTNAPMILAKRHLLWGAPLLAEDAHRIGLVTDLVDAREDVDARAMALAAEVADLAPVAVQLTKRALNQVVAARTSEAFDLGFYLEAMSLHTDDMVEAVTAFLEKRRPTWTGR